MHGEVDHGTGSWCVVWSMDGSWRDAVVEPARDEIAARAVRDVRFEVNRAAVSLTVRTDGGQEGALEAAQDACRQSDVRVINGPGALWLAAYGRRTFICAGFSGYDECLAYLRWIGGRCSDLGLYAIRGDNVEHAESALQREFGKWVLVHRDQIAETPPVSRLLKMMWKDPVSAGVIQQQYDKLISLSVAAFAWTAEKAQYKCAMDFFSMYATAHVRASKDLPPIPEDEEEDNMPES